MASSWWCGVRDPRPLALAALALLIGCSPAPTKDEQRARAIEQSFVGRFTGTFERREGAETITLPARMTGKRLSEGGVELVIEHGVPPPVGGGGERITTRLRVLAASRELEYTSGDGARSERFRIERFAAFTGLGELIVTGSTQEAGRPVELRILYSVEPGKLTWSRDSRPPGGEFKFRQRYTMRRGR